MATHETQHVLGIDPGSRRCGWGIVCRRGAALTHVAHGLIVLPEQRSLAERLAQLFDALEAVLRAHPVQSAAVEGVFSHLNVRSTVVLSHARGVALAALARAGLTVAEYTPQQIKKAVTGTGRAEKPQVSQLVCLRLHLDTPPPEDAADAIAVALCHAQHSALPAAPQAQRDQLRATPKSRRQAQQGLAALALAQGHSPPALPGALQRHLRDLGRP